MTVYADQSAGDHPQAELQEVARAQLPEVGVHIEAEAGADPGQIRMAFTGTQSITLDGQGNLLLTTPTGTIQQHAPQVYQQDSAGGRQPVAGQACRTSSAIWQASWRPL